METNSEGSFSGRSTNDAGNGDKGQRTESSQQAKTSQASQEGMEASNEDSQARLMSELTAASEEASHMKDQLTRALADLENLRKRSLKEKIELRQVAAAHVMEDLIPALDSMRMGIASAKQVPEAKGITDGFVMVYEQLKRALNNHGLEEILPNGAKFDPNMHECVTRSHHDSVPEGHVLEVVRPGYLLNGKMIRPASVVASSGPEKSTQTTA